MPTQKINFSIGMDKDSEDRLIPDGAYRDALNLRFVSQDLDGSDGSGENILGTVEVIVESISGLSNPVVIGSFDNKIKKAVYYLVCSSGNSAGHSIIEYSYENYTTTVLLTDALLGFDEDYPISGIGMVQDMLFWTDDNSEPKYVNVERLRNNEYPSPLAEEYITIISPLPPDLKVVESQLTSIENAQEVIQSYQFAVQFQYADSQWSKLSGYSEVPVKTSSTSYLNITVPLGNETVIAVRLLFRVKPTDLTATDWFIYNTYYPLTSTYTSSVGVRYVDGYANVDDSSILVNFYNSSIYNTLNLSESSEIFDFVPLKAKSLSVVDSSRLVMGNIVEGFDLPISDTSAEVKYNSVPATIETDITGTGAGVTPTYVYSEYTVNAIRSGETISSSISFEIDSATDTSLDHVIQWGFPSKELKETGIRVLTLTTDSITTITQKIVDAINDLDRIARISNAAGTDESFETMFAAVVTGTDTFELRTYIVTPFSDSYNLITTPSGFSGSTDRPVSVFKSGMRHEFGIIYYDKYGRSSSVLTDNTEVSISPLASSNSGSNYIEYTINHLPPSWATSYRIAMRQKTYYSLMIKTGTVSSNTYELSELISYNDDNENSVLSYDWVSGDRVRRVYDDSANGFFSSTDDLEIIKYDNGTPSITASGSLSITTGDWIEIYRPAKAVEGSSIPYSNITDAIPITGGYHTGDVQDQTSSQPAILRLERGNAYRRNRTMNGETVYIEDSNMTDFSLTSGTSAGKPNLTDKYSSQNRRETTVYWSEKFIPNTQVNGLMSFYGNSFRDYNKNYGGIYKLHSNGYSLYIFQELKVCLSYVEKVMFNDYSGGQTVGASTATLSDPRYYDGEYGIGKYPFSFSYYGSDMYFADPLRGAVLRLNQGGLVPISGNGLRAWFNLYLSSIQEQDTFNELDLIATNDIRYNEYILTLKAPIRVNTTCTATQSTAEPKTRFNITIEAQYESLFTVSDTVTVYYPNADARVESTTATVISISGTSLVVDSNVIASIDPTPFSVTVVVESNKTIAFNEGSKSWKTFYSFVPDFYSQAGINFVSFIDENVQRHGVSLTRNNFYGTQYNSSVTFVANENFITPKSWTAIELYSSDTCDAEITNNMSQESELLTTDFERYEDYFYSNFLCDSTTPNVTDPLLNGDNLRSNNLIVKLTNASTSQFRILMAGIRYVISRFVQ